MSQPSLFVGAGAKIDRARQQTNALKAEFDVFYGEQTYSISQTLDPETGRKTAVFNITRPFPGTPLS